MTTQKVEIAPEAVALLEADQNAAALGIGSQGMVDHDLAIIQACHSLDAFVAGESAAQADKEWQDFLSQHAEAPVLSADNFDALYAAAQEWLYSGHGYFDGHPVDPSDELHHHIYG